MLKVIEVASICHEANRQYCESIGDLSQPTWEEAPEWQRESAIKGVNFVMENPNAPASANHDSWLKQKLDDGWKYGPVKNPDIKEHPCCVAYEELPTDQKAKDYLFKGVVESLRTFVA